MSRFTRDGLRFRAPSAIQNVSRATRKANDEISCLSAAGFSDLSLARARARATALAVSPAQLMISEGQIQEDEFYRHYAHFMGAEFVADIPLLSEGCDWISALRSGTAKLANGRWIMAPRDGALTSLTHRLTRAARPDLVITSPSLFRHAIMRQFGARISTHAAQHLSQIKPDASAQTGISRGQKRLLSAFAAMICFGLVDGGAVWAMCCALFSMAMAFSVAMRLIGTFQALAPVRQKAPPLPDALLPTYTILVPLYREANILDQLITNLTALDYPRARHEIFLLIEEDDQATHQALAQRRLPQHMNVLIMPAGWPRTKPRALNVGLLHARGDYLVIYDAEDRPEPDQLRKAAATFAQGSPKLACLQASLAIENVRDSWLTRLFAIDYAGHFDVVHWGHARMGLPLPLGGTSNHFRTAHLREIGGWDAWNVTEDADLGLRLARHGFACQMLASTTWEEAPPTLADWLPQRRRWMKGWLQTFLTHTRKPHAVFYETGLLSGLHIQSLLIANTFGPMVGIWFTWLVLWHAWTGELFQPTAHWTSYLADLCWTSLAIAGFVSMVNATVLAATRRRLLTSLPWLVLRALYWICLSWAALQAVLELIQNPFHWSKTRHGLSKDRAPADP